MHESINFSNGQKQILEYFIKHIYNNNGRQYTCVASTTPKGSSFPKCISNVKFLCNKSQHINHIFVFILDISKCSICIALECIPSTFVVGRRHAMTYKFVCFIITIIIIVFSSSYKIIFSRERYLYRSVWRACHIH